MIEHQGIDDAVAHESVDFEPLIFRHQHFLPLVVERQNPPVDIDDVIDERRLQVQSRSVDHVADRLAEAQHQSLLGGIDGIEREAHDQRQQADQHEAAEGEGRAAHLTAPAGAGGSTAI